MLFALLIDLFTERKKTLHTTRYVSDVSLSHLTFHITRYSFDVCMSHFVVYFLPHRFYGRCKVT